MTPDEKARAEALGVMLGAREQVGLTVQEQSRYVEGFVAGSAWQRSQPVEVTEEMVEEVAAILAQVTGEPRPGRFERTMARAALSAALPFLRPEPSEGYATCETCGVTFTGGADDRFEVEHMGDRKHRVRALISIPEPSGDEREALTKLIERHATVTQGPDGWYYTDAADLASALLAAGFTRRPMPSRDEIADEVSGIQVGSGYYATVIGRDAALEAADAVLALFEKGAEG